MLIMLIDGRMQMDSKIQEQVIKYANEFRDAMEEAKEHGEFQSRLDLENFPKGACGIASDLLGEYLREHGIKSTYVCGWKISSLPNETSQSHAWLIVDGLIVDITGDQFQKDTEYYSYNQRVYVGEKDLFHTLFKVCLNQVHQFRGLTSGEDKHYYRIIKRYCSY